MSENDKITEETANDTLPAEVETDLAEQETDVMPAEPEEEEIAPEDVKIFGMPRHVFHWTAIGAAGGYILPDSATRRLTQVDVADLTWEQCCLARNEIYARHGRIFQTKQIAAYFEAQSWYHGTVPGASFDNNMLSPIEHANADFLTSYENATWGHSYY